MRKPAPLTALNALLLSLATAAAPGTAADIASADSRAVVPPTFSVAGGNQVAAWSLLGDDTLVDLIEQALAANTDLRQAIARLEIARAAQHGIATEALPTSQASVQRQSGDPPLPAWAGTTSLSWEVDLFGRRARLRDAARARSEGAEATMEAARLAVAADVARTWFQLQGMREIVALRERSLQTTDRMASIAGSLVELGDAPPDVSARGRAETASVRADLQSDRDTVFALEARLAVLLGESPVRWRAPPSATLATLRLHWLALPAPAELLRARPDVRAAERELAARGADARAASAARFPRVSLTGVLGFLAGSFGGLGNAGPETRIQAASLTWDPLALPRLNADVGQARAGVRVALAAYDSVVLRALEETEVTLQRHASASERVRTRLTAARLAGAAASAVEARYEEGAAPFMEALIARRDAIEAERSAVETLVEQRIAVIDVLRALGIAPTPSSLRPVGDAR